MKPLKRLLGLFAAVCLAQTAVAVPATPRPITVKQADGTLLTILLRGDEHGHVAMTTDGRPVFFNSATANYEYATLAANGELAGCGIVAKEAPRRTDADNLFLMKQDVQAIFNSVENHRLERKAKSSLAWGKGRTSATSGNGKPNRILISNYPTTGEQHTLVILIQFSDTKFTTMDDAKTYYEGLLNEEGFTHANGANGSARDFYMASSNGKFRPTFDVVGPITMPNTCSYYGSNVGGDDNYTRIADMIYEAVKEADETVDFTQYDTDGDGYIDNIYFFYAGFGEADSNKANTIWPHSYSWDEFLTYGYTTKQLVVDGKKMGSYACSQEINGSNPTMPVGIGTVSHEFGHVIGLPDLYDIYYGATTFTPGEFDAMDLGSYNNDQNTPPIFSAYERGELGWLDYTVLEAGTDTVSLLPDVKDSNMAYVVPVEGTNGREFFVLENRQQKGWDEYIPGHGMLMWHIDIDTTVWASNSVNTVGSHQRIDIVEADNRRTNASTSGDPFPGTANVTRWTMTSWAGDTLRVLDDIEEKDGNIYLLLGGLNKTVATPTLTVADEQDSSVCVKWSLVDLANTYTLTVCEAGEPLAAYNGVAYKDCDSARIEGLKPATAYTVKLVASRGSYASDTVCVSVQTKKLAFEKFMPAGIALAASTEGNAGTASLVASWDAMEEADDYLVSLARHSYDTEADTTGYDFGQSDSGMPEGWSKNGAYVQSAGYSVEVPSLRLNNKSNYLLMSQPSARIDSLSFWLKQTTTALGTLIVETKANGEWSQAATYDINPIDEAVATTHTLTFAAADTVRIRFDRTRGSVYLDNVAVRHHALQRLAVSGYENVLTGGQTTYTFTGLTLGSTYGFTVQGKQGERLSYRSPERTIYLKDATTGIVAPSIYNKENAAAKFYDLQGRPMAKPQDKGIYIKVENGKATKMAQ